MGQKFKKYTAYFLLGLIPVYFVFTIWVVIAEAWDVYQSFKEGQKYIIFLGFDGAFILFLLVFILLSVALVVKYVKVPEKGFQKLLYDFILPISVCFILMYFYIINTGNIAQYYIQNNPGTDDYKICFTQKRLGRGVFSKLYLVARTDQDCEPVSDLGKRTKINKIKELVNQLNSNGI